MKRRCDNSRRENNENGNTNILKPLSKKKLCSYDFVGFDVETYSDDNLFYMGGLYYYTSSGKPKYKAYYDKKEMINDLLYSRKFRNKYITATNLNFDLTVLFFDSEEWNNIEILKQQSNIIYAKHKDSNTKFLDTFNYFKASVQKMGELLGKEKLEKPRCLGFIPENESERKELEEYNKRDCEISCDFMYFFQKGVNSVGGNVKITIASTSFDVWRRNFLDRNLIKEEYVLKDSEIKNFLFEGYYGGRTEVFRRGTFTDVYYYDINSLYPAVMQKKIPLPSSIKKIKTPSLENIQKYEGVSNVLVFCPSDIRPLLPKRIKNKLCFPSGRFYGTYNHNELRKAVQEGYEIQEVSRQVIYESTFYPFNDFVKKFYRLKSEHKRKKDGLDVTYKLILNSLYGKFGQKKVTKTSIFDLNRCSSDEEYKNLKNFIKDKDYETDSEGKILINEEEEYNGINCFPIIASYITSYARILMYDYLKNPYVIYTDTDSCICEKPVFSHSTKLGEMKKEGEFDYCYVVKPKMYFVKNEDEQEIKVKGLNKATEEDFFNIIDGKTIKKLKFAKLNECFRRGLKINQILEVSKSFSLEDEKRVWFGKDSVPIKLNEVYNG
ncbi:MAG: DNA polymerase [Atribacterota bacterium]